MIPVGIFFRLFPFSCRCESCLNCRKLFHQEESNEKADHGVNDEPHDAKIIGTEPCRHGINGKVCIATVKKGSHGLTFWVPEMALTRRAASGWKRLLPNPLSMGKMRMNQLYWVKVMAERLNPQRKIPRGDQVGKGYTDRIIADERFRYRDKDNIGKMMPAAPL